MTAYLWWKVGVFTVLVVGAYRALVVRPIALRMLQGRVVLDCAKTGVQHGHHWTDLDRTGWIGSHLLALWRRCQLRVGHCLVDGHAW